MKQITVGDTKVKLNSEEEMEVLLALNEFYKKPFEEDLKDINVGFCMVACAYTGRMKLKDKLFKAFTSPQSKKLHFDKTTGEGFYTN